MAPKKIYQKLHPLFLYMLSSGEVILKQIESNKSFIDDIKFEIYWLNLKKGY